MLRTARILLVGTIAYNLAEGVIAIWSGISAGSIALMSFGAIWLEVFAKLKPPGQPISPIRQERPMPFAPREC